MTRQLLCECGDCRRCKHREYMRDYYRRPGKAEKQKEAAARRYRENAEQIRERVARYRQENIEQIREYDRARSYRGAPLEKRRARKAVFKAVERGELVPQPCEICAADGVLHDGRRMVQAHHDDYSRPLEVRWLCTQHHGETHRVVA